jgi:hypothetical protein
MPLPVIFDGRSGGQVAADLNAALAELAASIEAIGQGQASDQISTDPDNQLTTGADSKLFVPPTQLSSAQW